MSSLSKLNCFLASACLVLLAWLFWVSASLGRLDPLLVEVREEKQAVLARTQQLRRENSANQKQLEPRRSAKGGPARIWLKKSSTRNGAVTTSDPQLMKDPEFFSEYSVYLRGLIRNEYGPLFKKMKLSGTLISSFEVLIEQRIVDALDLTAARMEHPEAGGAMYMKMKSDMEASNDSNIKALLGADKFALWTSYNQLLPNMSQVSQLQARLSYTETPLTSEQGDSLAALSSEASTLQHVRQPVLSQLPAAKLEAILSPPQLLSLKSIDAERAELTAIALKRANTGRPH
jgi:hypothetical protein